MRICRNFGLAVVVSAALVSVSVEARPVPTYNGKFNNAVGGIVQAKTSKWGFSPTDPRVNATFTGIGSGLTTLAVGVGTGAVATVGWPVLLVGAGISALVGGAVALGQDAITKWLFNPDGSVTTTTVGNANVLAPGTSYIADGATASRYNSITDALLSGSSQASIMSSCCSANPNAVWKYEYGAVPGYSTLKIVNSTNNNMLYQWSSLITILTDAAANRALANPDPTTATESTDLPEFVFGKITDLEAAKEASNELLAAAINAAWKLQNMQLGGVPWSSSDPVTPADVAAWKAANPGKVPTVNDVLSPATAGTDVKVKPDTAGTDPAAEPTPGEGTKIDLGINPNIPAPILEATPTASDILSPLLNLMPDLKSFAVPAHEAGCPTGSFVAFGSTYTLDSHCTLIESNRSLIEAAMLLCWTLASVFIVLRA